ncbi:MAG TPA: ABC transporter permease [Pyrinomonadaceae bacterium]|nr:ABC transporter permease [Pyrinomonadaceae bacterium]
MPEGKTLETVSDPAAMFATTGLNAGENERDADQAGEHKSYDVTMIRNIMGSLRKDIRYGMRGMLKHPGFTLIAILTLALGIGANTAMFTVVNAVLLRPLSFPESDKLVWLEGVNPQKGITSSNMSVPDLADWRAQSHVFEQLAGFVSGSVFLTSGDETERARATGETRVDPLVALKYE